MAYRRRGRAGRRSYRTMGRRRRRGLRNVRRARRMRTPPPGKIGYRL